MHRVTRLLKSYPYGKHHETRSSESKSKETHGQIRGLSNVQMKDIVELATIGLLLKAVKTSRVYTTQGRSYLTKRRLCSLAFLIARVAKLGKDHLSSSKSNI